MRNRAAVGHEPADPRRRPAVTGADDVLVALGLDTDAPGRSPSTPARCPAASRPTCWPRAGSIPRTLDEIVVGLDLPIAEAAMALARLERTGWVREAGGWFEAVVSWSERP